MNTASDEKEAGSNVGFTSYHCERISNTAFIERLAVKYDCRTQSANTVDMLSEIRTKNQLQQRIDKEQCAADLKEIETTFKSAKASANKEEQRKTKEADNALILRKDKADEAHGSVVTAEALKVKTARDAIPPLAEVENTASKALKKAQSNLDVEIEVVAVDQSSLDTSHASRIKRAENLQTKGHDDADTLKAKSTSDAESTFSTDTQDCTSENQERQALVDKDKQLVAEIGPLLQQLMKCKGGNAVNVATSFVEMSSLAKEHATSTTKVRTRLEQTMTAQARCAAQAFKKYPQFTKTLSNQQTLLSLEEGSVDDDGEQPVTGTGASNEDSHNENDNSATVTNTDTDNSYTSSSVASTSTTDISTTDTADQTEENKPTAVTGSYANWEQRLEEEDQHNIHTLEQCNATAKSTLASETNAIATLYAEQYKTTDSTYERTMSTAAKEKNTKDQQLQQRVTDKTDERDDAQAAFDNAAADVVDAEDFLALTLSEEAGALSASVKDRDEEKEKALADRNENVEDIVEESTAAKDKSLKDHDSLKETTEEACTLESEALQEEYQIVGEMEKHIKAFKLVGNERVL